MTYVLALLAAIMGGAAGAVLGFLVAAMLAPMMGISSFEGAAGYFAVFIGGPIGGILGIILGAVLVLRWRGRQGAGAISGGLGVVVIGVALVAAAIVGFLYLSQDTVNPNGAPPQLAFEIKLPPGATPPRDSERPITLVAGKNNMPGSLRAESLRDDGGRPVIAGFVEMYHRTSQRLLVVTMPNKTDVLFDIKLASVPKHSREFSAWQRVNWIGEVGKSQTRKATAADQYEIRYRADWAGEN